jgi:hypothetical protein
METKQTAVDFLKEKFIMIQWMLVRDEISRAKADELLKEWSDKAKQMEKEQIINAFVNGEHQQGFENESEQYYNETYAN